MRGWVRTRLREAYREGETGAIGNIVASTKHSVIAGLDPPIPIMWRGGASLSGMAGSSPAMTTENE